MKKILVTGGAGFLGKALIPRLPNVNIRVVSRNEGELIELKNIYPSIEIITGDISNRWIANKAMDGIDEVYHLAAMKSIEIAEQNVFTCVQSNVMGTLNLLQESMVVKPELFLFISTDKVAQISGVYGATKFLAERLTKEAENTNTDTKYRIVRYGNILYSTGSVLCKWKENILAGKGVYITNPGMTRFFWTVDEAIDLIFKCVEEATDSTPMVAEMKGMRMGDLLEAMMQKYGRVPVEVIGNRGGENFRETIDGKVYSDEVPQFTVAEIKELI